MRPADRLRACLGQPEKADLALLHEARHLADRLLDRHRGIDAMLIVQVDHADTEPRERTFTRRPDVLRPAVDAAILGARPAHDAELGRELDHVPVAPDRTADQLLIGVRAVHVGRVEESHAEIDGAMNRRDRFGVGFVAAGIEVGHAHAAEALLGNGQALRAEGAGLQWWSSMVADH